MSERAVDLKNLGMLTLSSKVALIVYLTDGGDYIIRLHDASKSNPSDHYTQVIIPKRAAPWLAAKLPSFTKKKGRPPVDKT